MNVCCCINKTMSNKTAEIFYKLRVLIAESFSEDLSNISKILDEVRPKNR